MMTMRPNSDRMEPVVEGPAAGRDTSYQYVEDLPEVREIEQGLPYRSFDEQTKRRNLDLEFKLLKKMTETKHHSEWLVTNTSDLQGQNRYSDILPYRDTAVVLADGSYINASFVARRPTEPLGKVIATQGPLPNTRERFWDMIWEQRVTAIIMISALNEAGKAKCDQYFPSSSRLVVGKFALTTVAERQEFPNLTLRQIKVERDGEADRLVQHWQSTAWPDHGSPDLDEEWPALEQLLDVIYEERIQEQNVVVHCSAGIGRTGTIIALHEITSGIKAQLERGASNVRISVFATVRRLREERWGMVQNRDQYTFIYKFVGKFIEEGVAEKSGAFIE